MASNALPQTLRSITTTKIKELSKQRSLFEKRRHEILTAASNASDLRTKARILLEGVTKLKGHPGDAFDNEDLDVDHPEGDETRVEDGTERARHANIRRFLLQGRYDPSVAESSLNEWIAGLEQELQYMEQSHDHAAFYSKLVTEWLEDLEVAPSGSVSLEEEAGAGEGMEKKVGRAEMHEQRRTWEEIVFREDSDVQADEIRAYLEDLFTKTPLSQQALKELRESIKSFATGHSSKKTWLTADDLEWVSNSLLKTDLLTKEKMGILKELMRNQSVAQEVADVLNMRLASLDSWCWPEEGIPVEMRRQLNGKYRVFMDEDVLDSLMFHYLGLKWSVTLRSAFVTFLGSRGWKTRRGTIPEKDKLRRMYFLGDENSRRCDQTVNEYRESVYRDEYFMTQLPASLRDGEREYDGSDSDPTEERRKNALDTKHALLHLLLTESIIHTTLHGQFTAVQSDFKWFGPSLPHTTIITVLAYFGVPEDWLNFFKTFLSAPIKFVQDGPDAVLVSRARGVPMSHTLSTFMSEAVLFCMDYAVNQSTDGSYLYRMHDDLWFWGQEDTCVKAWTAMNAFADVMGLEFNESKTGTVRLDGAADDEMSRSGYKPWAHSTTTAGKDKDLEPVPLPDGDIRWGLLQLDSPKRRFIIDQDRVTEHITELQRQLSSCRSVFAWIQAWNSYFGRFFVNNLAKPAVCFGREHIDMALSTLSHIERTLFSSGVTDHLRKMIAERFNVHDLPEGLFYFPIELGGLDLLNPYIPLLAMRENIRQTPHRRVLKAFLEDSATYLSEMEYAGKHGPRNPGAFNGSSGGDSDIPDSFLSLEEYMRYAESYSDAFLSAYKDLIRVPEQASANLTPSMRGNQTLLSDTRPRSTSGTGANAVSKNWEAMTPYGRWMAELYQEGMVKKYGSLAAVNREFVPVGVVETLKEGKFQWHG
ncbi:hypothetical protein ARAM_006854 [Aspergillus rambellii]|uniref:Reverse transcriptase domain-containing protein n=1 Tax=Aspergillus rambellii TaxID=308745 RepID=A0A0F8UNN5_9EURO|nr:hypothetical protein ARAM_006854 [Aspergillus rambellii]